MLYDPAEVQRRVDEIRQMPGDPEAAHVAEDALRSEVLVAIAAGFTADARECARLALTTDDIDFPRWCA